MSEFSDNWAQCMRNGGFPVPTVETANEALEYLHKLHDAWENAGGGEELTIGELLLGGAAVVGAGAAVVEFGEDALVVLGQIGQVAVAFYLSACVGCLASVALDELKNLFAGNELPDFVVAQLESQGVDLTTEAVA